jgi:prophage antirepressor-like protein
MSNVRLFTRELFDFAMESDTPAAKNFRRWLFREVVPEIHRTGRYSADMAQLDVLAAELLAARSHGAAK